MNITILDRFLQQVQILSNNKKNPEHITRPGLLLALQSLNRVLRRSMVDMLVSDLEKQDVTLHSDEKYSVKRVGGALVATFGSEGGMLLAKKLRKSLDLQ